MEVRPRFHRFPRAGARGTNRKGAEAFGQGMGWFQFYESAGHSGARCQRRCAAGARQLPWRTHALSWARHWPGLGVAVGQKAIAT